MGDLAEKTFFVTGGNAGIGYATVTALAGRGARVYLTSRSKAKGEAAVAAIKAATGSEEVRLLPLDLADLSSVRACAEEFLALGEPLHVLINNGGVAGRHGITADGFELQFGVNHLGHFALTQLLLPRLQENQEARIVSVSSEASFWAKGINFGALRHRTRSLIGMHEYSVSKLCNVLHMQELARRLEGSGARTYSLHPGRVASDIWRPVPWPARRIVTRGMLTTEQGAQTSLYCATSADVAGDTGKYYDNCRVTEPSKAATPDLAAELWQYSEKWTA
ncbi:MAG TPA: SDR family oxidoreductase [Streptosporangiaceae bacterium]|nr:SDR family oxidoreductase [Streptosporangiaceae bacterium]